MQLILATQNNSLYASERLVQEAKSLNLPILTHNPFNELISNYSELKNLNDTIILHRTTGRHFNDIDLHFSKLHELHGALVINPLKELQVFRDKGHQMLYFKEHNLASVPSAMLSGAPSHETIKSLFETFKNFLTNDQFILKTVRGSKGVGVMLLQGKQSLESVLEAHFALGDQRFLVQPYLSDAEEFRLFYIKGEKPLFGEKIKSSDDFRGNSGRAILKIRSENEIPKDAVHLLKQAMNLSKAIYGAIDLLYYHDKPYLLEQNGVPGFKDMEKETGLNIAKMILQKSIELREQKK